MTCWTYEELRRFVGKVAEIRITEGEVLRAKVFHVDPEHRDLAVDRPIETTQPWHYEGDAPGTGYAIPWDYIAGIREVGDSGSQGPTGDK